MVSAFPWLLRAYFKPFSAACHASFLLPYPTVCWHTLLFLPLMLLSSLSVFAAGLSNTYISSSVQVHGYNSQLTVSLSLVILPWDVIVHYQVHMWTSAVRGRAWATEYGHFLFCVIIWVFSEQPRTTKQWMSTQKLNEGMNKYTMTCFGPFKLPRHR